jgi:hypothetical protein
VPTVAPAATNQQGMVDEGEETVSNVLPSALTPAPLAVERNEKALVSEKSLVANTRIVIAPQSTPDGRVLPMPIHASVITPHATTTTLIAQYENSEDGVTATPTDRHPVTPNVGSVLHTMGPPPNRRSTTVTPTENNMTDRTSTQNTGHMVTKLFENEGLSFTNDKKSDSSNVVKQPFELTVQDSVEDASKMDDVDCEDFHQRHQQFVTMIRDLHDMDQKFQDMMLDGSLQIDVATALLLQMKCDTYDLTDQILQQLDYANVALCEFLQQEK